MKIALRRNRLPLHDHSTPKKKRKKNAPSNLDSLSRGCTERKVEHMSKVFEFDKEHKTKDYEFQKELRVEELSHKRKELQQQDDHKMKEMQQVKSLVTNTVVWPVALSSEITESDMGICSNVLDNKYRNNLVQWRVLLVALEICQNPSLTDVVNQMGRVVMLLTHSNLGSSTQVNL
ncbi:MAG: hypothetical protein ACREOZ_03540 [Gloeomargaritales cyanobacterium]